MWNYAHAQLGLYELYLMDSVRTRSLLRRKVLASEYIHAPSPTSNPYSHLHPHPNTQPPYLPIPLPKW